MSYYLPIKIRGNKIHVCHLTNPQEGSCIPTYYFLFDKPETTIFTIDISQAQLISDVSHSQNTPLRSCHIYGMEKLEDPYKMQISNGCTEPNYTGKQEEYTVYRFKIVPQTLKIKSDICTEEIKLDRRSLSNGNICSVSIDRTKIQATAFVIELVYMGSESTSYTYRFRCAYNNSERRIGTAALDFGSEASQMRCDIGGQNVQIIRRLKGMIYPDNDREVYRQGGVKDPLFKSLFFLNRNMPDTAITYWGDAPMKYQENSLLQLLIRTTGINYDSLTQIPNLKLLELSGGRWENPDINIPIGSSVDITNIAFTEDQQKLLRIILSQFLYVALKEYNGRTNYLHFILLVPNVYLQNKINSIIRNLYTDFDIIRTHNRDYTSFEGIEIHVISESDASFLGYIQTKQPYKKGREYSLIIDTGKGTTDFSIILGDSNNYTRFQSVYRAGIPIAGNILTYAVYEATKDWLNSNGVTIDDKLRDASPDLLIDFMEEMESIKINHINYNGTPSKPGSDLKKLGLRELNVYIQNEIIKEHKLLPELETYIKNQCDNITSMIYKYLDGFVSQNNITFANVVLTGRGFLLKSFYNTVKDRIIQEGWAKEDAFLTLNGTDIKTKCLDGALNYTNIDVNCQSDIIGSVHFGNTTTLYGKRMSKIKQLLNKIFGKGRHDINEEFFYNGAHCSSGSTTVNISCFSQTLGFNDLTDIHLYFIGNGFLAQTGDLVQLLDENHFRHYFDEKLINASLFPYWRDSIPDPQLERTTQQETTTDKNQSSKIESQTIIRDSNQQDNTGNFNAADQ